MRHHFCLWVSYYGYFAQFFPIASFIIYHRRVSRLHKHPHLHLQERFLNAAARLGGIAPLVITDGR